MIVLLKQFSSCKLNILLYNDCCIRINHLANFSYYAGIMLVFSGTHYVPNYTVCLVVYLKISTNLILYTDLPVLVKEYEEDESIIVRVYLAMRHVQPFICATLLGYPISSFYSTWAKTNLEEETHCTLCLASFWNV